mmetsp:Transcript_36055/g.64473  ORF Transcript_36055/g.64473 Transcript_36055/m.64473 type:complete len:238 (-) Transcript_36055:462-1175(-)
MSIWQSILSVIPPCPGMESPKSFTLKARLKPLAKKPPKGPMREAKTASAQACSWMGCALKLTPFTHSIGPCGAQGCRDRSAMGSSSMSGTQGSRSYTVNTVSVYSGSSSQSSEPRMERSWRAQVSHLYLPRKAERKKANTMVPTAPPTKPSQVFFGDSFISGVFPKKKPARYAAMSLVMMSEQGRMSQMRPSKVLETKKEEGTKTVIRIMCVHAYCPNWYKYIFFFRLSTNMTKPAQ